MINAHNYQSHQQEKATQLSTSIQSHQPDKCTQVLVPSAIERESGKERTALNLIKSRSLFKKCQFCGPARGMHTAVSSILSASKKKQKKTLLSQFNLVSREKHSCNSSILFARENHTAVNQSYQPEKNTQLSIQSHQPEKITQLSTQSHQPQKFT